MNFKRYFKKIGPGLITGGADNDPSGIASYSISGARFGFSQLWLMVLATPMLVAVQSMCSRLADVKRKGLSTLLQEEFSSAVSWAATSILLIANTVTIGADILAVALALQLVTNIGLKFWVLPVTIVIWYFVLFENYKVIAKYLSILLLFFLAYLVAAIVSHPNWGEVFANMFWPHVHAGKEYFIAAVAILGTTITPYLFFWQVKEELEERKPVLQAMREARHEDALNAPGFIFSQIITLSIMIAAAVTLSHGGLGIRTAADAAKALEPVAGKWAVDIFAVGIIGAGLLSIPVLAVASAAVVSETAGFRHQSLNNKIKSAKGFYAVITLSLLAGVGILIVGVDPLKALYYSQVLAGLLAPLLLIFILILCNKQTVMGEFRNKWFDNFFGTLAFLVMIIAAVLMFVK